MKELILVEEYFETFILAIFLYFANALSLPLISLSFEMAG